MANRVLEVIVFPGGLNWPIWAAQENGFFAAQGIDVKLGFTAGSVQLITELVAGKYDLAMAGMDNLIAYQEGQGEVELDREPDLFAFMGADDAFLRLVVQPDIQSYDDLKGKELSVDAITTGFAFVLRKMLERAGLTENDYRFVSAGGVLERWEALKEGKHAGTLLVTPFEIIAKRLGLGVLQNAADVFDHYQGVVGMAQRAWASEHGDELVAYIKGYISGLAWLFDGTNKEAALAILMKNVPNMPPVIAAETYDVFLDPEHGFEPEARLDVEGLRTVLALRSEYGRPQKTLSDPRAYDDQSYYERALAER